MNLTSIQTALRDLQASGGSKAEATLTISAGSSPYVYFKPIGWGGDNPSILEHGDTPEAAIAAAVQKWAEISGNVRTETTKKMALAIISITHEHGSYTDAALRAEFDTTDVRKYGSEAVALANSMADGGPFSIKLSAKANAA